MLNLVFRDKTKISILIIGAMLVADFIWFGYLPSQDRLKTLRQARRLQAVKINRAKHERLQLPRLRERLCRSEVEIAQSEARLPQQKGMGQFLEDMSGLMAKHGLAEQVMIPLDEARVGSVSCLPITFRCQGRLAQIFAFYRDLADLGRLVRVQKVSLDNDNLQGTVSMEAQMVIFYGTREPVEAMSVVRLL
jgi:Tfp pilus assembly protein PilO